MAFDNRHTVASRRTVLPPAAPNSRTFTKGIALGVVVGAVSATLTYAALFAGPNRTTALIATASVVSPKPASAAVRTDAGVEHAAVPAPAPAVSETKSEPAPPAAAAKPTSAVASAEPAAISPEVQPQVQREESRPRQRRERHTARRERPRNQTGWYGDAGANPWGRSNQNYYRGRNEWSW